MEDTKSMLDLSHLELLPSEINCVLYHKNCSDGFGAAWSAWKYLSTTFPNRDVEYIAVSHGTLPPNVEGKNVLITDFSYSYDILERMIQSSNKLAIIDHHKSALENLQKIDEKYKVFRMDMSGASMTWCYFFPNEKMPLMIKYIEDRDIWANKLPLIQEYFTWFFTLEFKFEVYDKYYDDKVFEDALYEAKSMVYLNNYNISQISKYASPKFVEINNKLYFVAYINSNILKSDIGNRLISNSYPYCDFSATYNIDDRYNSTSFSLRSTNTHSDVSNIAKSFGGGGHRNASGVKVNYVTSTLPGSVYDHTGNLYNSLHNTLQLMTVNTTSGLSYNVGIINSSVLRKKISKYLLQDKYSYVDNKTKECINVQSCGPILSDIYQDSLLINSKYHFVFGWYYDTTKNKINLRVIGDKHLNDTDFLEISNYLCTLGGEPDTLHRNVYYFENIHNFIKPREC